MFNPLIQDIPESIACRQCLFCKHCKIEEGASITSGKCETGNVNINSDSPHDCWEFERNMAPDRPFYLMDRGKDICIVCKNECKPGLPTCSKVRINGKLYDPICTKCIVIIERVMRLGK